MKLLLALMLAQIGEAPNVIMHLQNGIDGAQLIENVNESDGDLQSSKIRASGGINLDDVGHVRREAMDASDVRVVDQTPTFIEHGLYPDRHPADIDQIQPDPAFKHPGNNDVEIASLKILDRTDGVRGGPRGQDRDNQADSAEDDTDGAVEDTQEIDTQTGDGNAVANGDGFYSRPLGTQIGILAAIGGIACCAMFAGLLMLCLGRGPFLSREVNTVYGGIIAVLGLLLLFKSLYLSIADVAGFP